MLIASGSDRPLYAPADGAAFGSVRESTTDDVTDVVAANSSELEPWCRAGIRVESTTDG